MQYEYREGEIVHFEVTWDVAISILETEKPMREFPNYSYFLVEGCWAVLTVKNLVYTI